MGASPFGCLRAVGCGAIPLPVRSALQKVLCTFCLSDDTNTQLAWRAHVPSIVHQVLPATKRTIIVGDVHGCLDELDALLRQCTHDPLRDRVVLVGDLVNKGPKSAAVVRAARSRGFQAVRGNHDDRALFEWERRERARRNGGVPDADDKYAYTDAFNDEDVAFLRSLPYTLRLEGDRVLVVHAGVVPGVPLHAQQTRHMYTMRNLIRASSLVSLSNTGDSVDDTKPAGKHAAWEARSSMSDGVAWASEWRPDEANFPGVAHVVFGHDARRGLQQHAHTTGLDSGCCYGKRLTALVLPDWTLVSVPAARVYQQPDGDEHTGPV